MTFALHAKPPSPNGMISPTSSGVNSQIIQPDNKETGQIAVSSGDYQRDMKEMKSQTQDNFDFSKAVRADDAEIPTFIWDERIWKLGFHSQLHLSLFQDRLKNSCPLAMIWEFFLRWWRKKVWRSLRRFLHATHGPSWADCPDAQQERDVERDCLVHVTGADWWEWREGSTLMFWRWPSYARDLALNSHKPWFISKPPEYKVPQQQANDQVARVKIRAKLEIPVAHRYIVKGSVSSLTSYFAVPKGDTDIRLVYDASKSGLNSSLWVPSFSLPSMET